MDLIDLAAHGQGPPHFLIAPILWNPNLENELLTPNIEMRRLPLIRVTLLDLIIGTDRDIQRLLVVAIHIPENQAERPIGVSLPAFETRSHVLTGCVLCFPA